MSISAARRGRSQTWPSQGTTSFWVQKVRGTCNDPFSLSYCQTSCGPDPGSGRASKRGDSSSSGTSGSGAGASGVPSCADPWCTRSSSSPMAPPPPRPPPRLGGRAWQPTLSTPPTCSTQPQPQDVTPEGTTLLLCGAVRALRTQRSKPNQLLYVSLLLAKSELSFFLSSLQDQVL